MRMPVRPLRGRWPAALERRLTRFVRIDPRVMVDDAASPEDFRLAMSSVYVGDTIKITAAGNRHGEADALLADNLDLAGAHVVDIGASDGTTSLHLLDQVPQVGAFTIADLYLTLSAAATRHHVVFDDADGNSVLVVGRRLVAWPGLSRWVALAYAPVLRRAARSADRREVLLLNPQVRARMAEDPRVRYRVHDVFTPWTGDRPDVIKVANLLRRLYFSDEQISVALRALLTSLPEGGHLLVVDNPRLKNTPPRSGLYRRVAGSFVEAARSQGEPEIADLVLAVQLEDVPAR